MNEVELVIKIPKKEYDMVLHAEKGSTINLFLTLCACIINGTPLKKGHGRLIDANEVTAYNNLYEVPTIIEADKEDKDKCENN